VRHLFPGLALQPVLFPHLDRTQRLNRHARPLRALRDRFDLFLCLRWDAMIKDHLDDAAVSYHASESDWLDLPVAFEQRERVIAWTGPYDLLSAYLYSAPPTLVAQPRVVGLCISAGFPLNAWPLSHWLELATRLQRRNVEVVLIGGPREGIRVRVLADV